MIKIIAFIFFIFGGLIVSRNWFLFYKTRKTGKLAIPIPIFGSVLMGVALLCFYQTRAYAWVGIIIDYHGTLSFLIDIPKLMQKDWETSTANLLYRFTSETNGRYDDIRLFKNLTFTIDSRYDFPIQYSKNGDYVQAYSFTGKWKQNGTEFLLKNYKKDRLAKIIISNEKYFMFESNYTENEEYNYDRLDSLELTMSKEI
jgi:hypothetical protein